MRDRFSPGRFLTQLCTLLCLGATLLQIGVQLPRVARVAAEGRDIEVYYRAARAARARATPYTALGTLALQPKLADYIYPPPFALAIAPLGGLSPAVFYRVWFILLEVALWIFCTALLEIAGSTRAWQVMLLAGPLALSPLLFVSFGFGQADLFVFTLSALGLVLAQRGRPHLAAVVLVAAACAKIYPVLLLLPLARRFGWRVLATAAGAGAAAAAASAAWFGPGIFGDFVRNALPRVAQGYPHAENISPAALLTRFAVWAGWADPALPAPAWLRIGVLAITLGMLGVVGWITWRIPFPRSYGWVSGLSVLFAAYCFTAFWSMFLPAAALKWRESKAASGQPCFAVVLGTVLLASLAADASDALWFKGPLIILTIFVVLDFFTRDGRGAASGPPSTPPSPPP